MTTSTRPTPAQIHDAILWLEWYHTGGNHHDAVDRTDHFKRILGDHTHQVITEAIKGWYRQNILTSIASIMHREVDDGATVTVEGDLFFLAEHEDRDGSPWVSALIADRETHADIEVLFFPMTYAIVNDLIAEGRSVRITGRVKHGDWSYLIATTVDPAIRLLADHDGPDFSVDFPAGSAAL